MLWCHRWSSRTTTTTTVLSALLNFSSNSPIHSFVVPKPNFHRQPTGAHFVSRRKYTGASTSTTMKMIHGKTFVSIEDAVAHHPSSSSPEKSDKKVVFIDGSWFLPSLGRNGKDEFLEGPRIEGSIFLDIDDVATPVSSEGGQKLPHVRRLRQFVCSGCVCVCVCVLTHSLSLSLLFSYIFSLLLPTTFNIDDAIQRHVFKVDGCQ